MPLSWKQQALSWLVLGGATLLGWTLMTYATPTKEDMLKASCYLPGLAWPAPPKAQSWLLVLFITGRGWETYYMPHIQYPVPVYCMPYL